MRAGGQVKVHPVVGTDRQFAFHLTCVCTGDTDDFVLAAARISRELVPLLAVSQVLPGVQCCLRLQLAVFVIILDRDRLDLLVYRFRIVGHGIGQCGIAQIKARINIIDVDGPCDGSIVIIDALFGQIAV